MAEEIERLLVVLEARTKAFETNLNRANQVADRRLRAVEKRFADANKRVAVSMAGVGKSFGGVFGGAFAFSAGAAGAKKLIDTATRIQNSLKTAGLAGDTLTRTYDQLFASAQKNSAPVESLVDLYSKLSIVQNDLGVSSGELISFTDNVALALRAGGTDATAASGALLQLSQALGGGVVRAEEFNSVLEGAPTIMRAVAAGMDGTGGSVAKLRAKVIAGEMSSVDFFRAFQKGVPVLEKMAADALPSISQSFQRLGNSLVDMATRMDKATGASGRIAYEIQQLGILFERAGRGAENIADFVSGDEADALKLIRQQVDDLFKSMRGGISAMNSASLVPFDQLRQKLQDGSISAEDAKKAIAAIADDHPRFAELVRQFDPLLDRLKAVQIAAVAAGASIEGVSTAGAGRGNGRIEVAARKERSFLQDRITELGKKDVEKEIDAKTDEILEAAAKVGVAIDRAAARIQATGEVIGGKVMTSRGGVLDDYVSQVVSAESGGKTDAKNPLSSATGLGQFINSTWIRLFKQVYPELANQSNEAILDLRKDGEISKQMIREYARENSQVLRAAGVSVDAAALHLAHFLGPGGAAKILKADPNALAADILGSAAARANPTIIGNGHTAGDVVAYGQKRAGMTTAGTEAVDRRVEGQEAYKATLDTIKERIALLNAESGAQAGLNPKIDDYGFAVEKARITQELLNDAQANGIAVTPALRAEIGALATDYANAAVAGDKLKARQDALADSQEVLAEKLAASSAFGKDVLGGFIRDLRDGKSATEALAGALDKVADKLLDMALNSLFDGVGKPGAGGGILGGLFGMLGFAKGGYTGHGGKHQPAGVVHKGEYVFSKSATQRLGAGNLERLHRGYAEGGLVSRPPGIPNGVRSGGDGVANVRVFVDQDGNWQAKVESISQRTATQVTRQGIVQYDKTLDRSIHGKVARAQARQG